MYTQGITAYYQRNIEDYRGRNDPEAIRAVTKEMEALFVYELIKAMRETANINKEEGLGKSIYQGMFDMELARLLSERGLGLSDLLIKGLNKSLQNLEVRNHASAKHSLVDSHLSSVDTNERCPMTNGWKDSETQTPSVETSSLPVDGIISSKFGIRRHPIYGNYRFHSGVDIAAEVGTIIYPIRGGRVIFSGEQKGYGNIVIIDHGDGLISKYAHNWANLVKEGDEVDTNTVIAQVGYSGNSTGPHLHLEIIDKESIVDPMEFLAKG